MKKKETGSFEEHLKEIEQIVEKLESGDIDIDEAIKQYEKGMALIERSRVLLKETKLKIEVLKRKGKKGWETESFEDGEEEEKEKEDKDGLF
jgi:exodeoxyribonuclease VII small subunit